MFGNSRLFGFPLIKESDYVEIGGGEGDLSLDLKNRGFNIILFIEPEIKKFEIASKKLKNTLCLNIDAENLNVGQINPKFKTLTVIMQDVIEHISFESLKVFFEIISIKYEQIHIHRFTDTSLTDFLERLDYKNIVVARENYKITGIVSLLRFPPYFLIILFVSLIYIFVFGTWEGMLTPNIYFYSKKIKHN